MRFNELDKYLNADFGPDAWYDFAIDCATELIEGLETTEEEQLKTIWQNRSVAWQVRLAEAAAGSDKEEQAVDLLAQMLTSPEVQVALAAAEGLEGTDHIWTPSPALRNDLERLRERVQGFDRATVEGLIARIPHPESARDRAAQF